MELVYKIEEDLGSYFHYSHRLSGCYSSELFDDGRNFSMCKRCSIWWWFYTLVVLLPYWCVKWAMDKLRATK